MYDERKDSNPGKKKRHHRNMQVRHRQNKSEVKNPGENDMTRNKIIAMGMKGRHHVK